MDEGRFRKGMDKKGREDGEKGKKTKTKKTRKRQDKILKLDDVISASHRFTELSLSLFYQSSYPTPLLSYLPTTSGVQGLHEIIAMIDRYQYQYQRTNTLINFSENSHPLLPVPAGTPPSNPATASASQSNANVPEGNTVAHPRIPLLGGASCE